MFYILVVSLVPKNLFSVTAKKLDPFQANLPLMAKSCDWFLLAICGVKSVEESHFK